MDFREALLAIRPDTDLDLIGRAYTMPQLRRDFGTGIATIVDRQMALGNLRYSHYELSQTLAAIGSAGSRAVTLKLADRLHNMRTLRCIPQPKQLRKAREVIDVFLPVAQQLGISTVKAELQSLAFATLIRNRPADPPRRRAIVGLDIEKSTSRPDPIKAEFRVMLYELFEAALRSAGIGPDRRGEFMDRGDGLLVLVDPAVLAALLSRVVPVFAQLLAGYNAGLPPQRQLRVRAVIHAGDVRDDDNGCFGTALDVACRLLDSPEAKAALETAPGPLLLVVSADIHDSVADLGHGAFRRLVTVPVAGREHAGWAGAPASFVPAWA